MGHFQFFSMILKFSMGHFLSFYTDFYGPFSKLMGLWRMTPCLPNHCSKYTKVNVNQVHLLYKSCNFDVSTSPVILVFLIKCRGVGLESKNLQWFVTERPSQ